MRDGSRDVAVWPTVPSGIELKLARTPVCGDIPPDDRIEIG